ncbi:MAG TPA: ABC transporter substrate-binding protein [Dehalococcoidia bacterium]|nr:ABC transporter substrate-binding protein [Dehalococcoidia bacterium]
MVQASPAAVNRAEPKGQVVYGWHTAIAPAWLDPQENPQQLTPYGWQYFLHDAVIKHLPGQPLAPSLAESYEVAPDLRSATIRLREGIKFHDGSPVTPDDVKWTYENYKGANASILKAKTDRLEILDQRTIRFLFKEPFPDFLILYGSPASGAGWVVPAKYYQQVGPDGFKLKPIGAGPYKFVQQTGGTEYEFEAFTEYWRKTPHIKTLVVRALPEAATRVGALQTGEVDFINIVPGELIETVRSNPNLRIAPLAASAIWLDFPGLDEPDNPLSNVKARQALSLALDRQAISDAEEAGLSPLEGNWIPEDWPGAIKRPPPPHDPARARQLLAEAGFAGGFDLEALTPFPPYFSTAERIITQLRDVGIRTRLQQMERGAFLERLSAGPDALRGIVMNVSAAPGDAASRIRAFAMCQGSSSRTCIPEVEEKFSRYEASADLQERERLLTEVQEYLLDNYIFVPVYRQAGIHALGPRIANPDEVIAKLPQWGYPVGPYEDLKLKE